ncbi:MAG: hypothetical protein IPN42_13225 [Methylococcaceae bacterium]|nr:hypothetical protein [Methylococcaceae bacterium]
MLDALTKEDWTKQLNESFYIQIGNTDKYPIKLIDVSGYGRSMGGSREAYSLLFSGPKMPILPQNIYSVNNSAFGALDIFLVPIGPQADGMGYEAVFT